MIRSRGFYLHAALICLTALAAVGCRKPVSFPAPAATGIADAAGAAEAYDVNLDRQADFFLLADAAGRIDRIGYDVTGDGKPDEVIPLDSIPFSHCRHLVLILDGFGYDVVKEFYDSGHLRLCYPPSRVVAPYPTLTDLAIQDVLGGVPARGFEALYFDRKTNRLLGGSSDYMNGLNEPYNRLLQYRASLMWDAIGYIKPWAVFGKELNDAKRVFDRSETTEVMAYFVSSAGMGTIQGAEGQRKCLQQVERLVDQVMWETRGLTKVTLLADHGHSYTPGKRIDMEGYLRGKGWRLSDRLNGPKDAVYVAFGLETYASFATQRPAELAADLSALDGVELASFADGQTVVVLGSGGSRAVVSRKADRYKYEAVAGDPLKLAPVLAKLSPDAEGYYGADDMLAATADQEYPAPLERLWRAHFSLALNTPDVIVSLADNRFAGASSFAGSVNIASTHGSLNRKNSTTFIMSTAGALPPLMRSRDVPAAMKALTGADWPMRR